MTFRNFEVLKNQDLEVSRDLDFIVLKFIGLRNLGFEVFEANKI
jgi:hypothetical protein